MDVSKKAVGVVVFFVKKKYCVIIGLLVEWFHTVNVMCLRNIH